MSDFYIKVGDTAPALAAVLEDANGPISLDGVASAAFNMTQVGGAVVINNKQATPDPDQSANPGLIRYWWDVDDTLIAGLFNAEFKIVWADARPRRFPNNQHITVEITENVA